MTFDLDAFERLVRFVMPSVVYNDTLLCIAECRRLQAQAVHPLSQDLANAPAPSALNAEAVAPSALIAEADALDAFVRDRIRGIAIGKGPSFAEVADKLRDISTLLRQLAKAPTPASAPTPVCAGPFVDARECPLHAKDVLGQPTAEPAASGPLSPSEREVANLMWNALRRVREYGDTDGVEEAYQAWLRGEADAPDTSDGAGGVDRRTDERPDAPSLATHDAYLDRHAFEIGVLRGAIEKLAADVYGDDRGKWVKLTEAMQIAFAKARADLDRRLDEDRAAGPKGGV